MTSSSDLACLAATAIADKVSDAMGIIREALRRYTPARVALSFNGGKDCTVILSLLSAALDEYYASSAGTESRPRLPCLYVSPADPFPEVEAFVLSEVRRHDLELMEIRCGMKDGLRAFLTRYPDVRAILIGNRRTDPYSGNLRPFDPTDNDWPEVMRVHPILDWDYADVWTYLRQLHHPYCSLYDLGYTSLGGTGDTIPNPALRSVQSACGFDPAHTLKDGSKERDSRLPKR